MASRSMNTQDEILRSVLNLLSDAKTAPDADLPWIIGVETQIVTKLREPIEKMMAASQTAGAPPMGGAPMGAPPMGGGSTPPPLGVAGLSTRPQMPNPDELRRILNVG